MTSANTMRLGGLMFGFLGWVNWGPLLALLWGFCRLISRFMVEFFLFFFFSVLAFWGFNSLPFAEN